MHSRLKLIRKYFRSQGFKIPCSRTQTWFSFRSLTFTYKTDYLTLIFIQKGDLFIYQIKWENLETTITKIENFIMFLSENFDIPTN